VKYLLAFLLAVALGYGVSVRTEAVNPPDSHQQNPDIYSCCGFPSVFSGTVAGDLSSLNPITTKLRTGVRTVTFSYQVVAGCNDGNMRQTLQLAINDSSFTGIQFTEVAVGAAMATIRATCGVDAANAGITGAVIADLYPSWPYQCTVNASTTMATFYNQSQEAIWLHEFLGHCLSTWNEQYQLNGTFGSTPGLVDFMNTGPDSRYIWPQDDKDRWERTNYPLTVAADPCLPLPPNADGLWWYPCEGRFYNQALWSFEPSTGIWYNPRGEPEWGQCVTKDHDCYDLRLGVWSFRNGPPYDPALGFLVPPVQEEKMMLRLVLAIAAGASALDTFLLAYPGDLVPQVALLVVGGATAFLTATAAFLAKPSP
jgi:hypothetical protein